MASPIIVNGYTGLLATAIQLRSQMTVLNTVAIYNPSNAVAYVQFYNLAGLSPTVGTTVADFVVAVPTLVNTVFPCDLLFSNGIWIVATTTAAGSTAPNTALFVSLGLG